jgi:arsenate reductase-like glutaredoxin family protein
MRIPFKNNITGELEWFFPEEIKKREDWYKKLDLEPEYTKVDVNKISKKEILHMMETLDTLKYLLDRYVTSNKEIQELGKNLTYKDMPNEEYQNKVTESARLRRKLFDVIKEFHFDI